MVKNIVLEKPFVFKKRRFVRIFLEFGDPDVPESKLTKHEVKVAERAAAVQAGDVAKISRIDACEEDRRK